MHFSGSHARATFGCEVSASMFVPMLLFISSCKNFSLKCCGSSNEGLSTCALCRSFTVMFRYEGASSPSLVAILLHRSDMQWKVHQRLTEMFIWKVGGFGQHEIKVESLVVERAWVIYCVAIWIFCLPIIFHSFILVCRFNCISIGMRSYDILKNQNTLF